MCKNGLNELGKRIVYHLTDYNRELKRVKKKLKETRNSIKTFLDEEDEYADLYEFTYCRVCNAIRTGGCCCEYKDCKYIKMMSYPWCEKHIVFCDECKDPFCIFHKKKKKVTHCKKCVKLLCMNCKINGHECE